jgi:Tfp pilus assembly protein PilN
MIAAGALAAIFLGAAFWSTREDMVDAADRAAKLERDYKSANNVHRRTEDLVAKNTQLEKVATELMSLKGAGEQVARSVDQLRAHLPAEFWLTRLSSDLRADPELGVARGAEKPILSVEGRAREGTNALNTQYEAFVQNLRSGLPSSAAMRERLTPNGSRFTIDICLLGARGAESSNEAKVAR